MKKLAVLALLVVPLAAGCSKGRSEKACKHMIGLASAELDKQIEQIDKLDKSGDMKKMVVEMKERAEAQSDSDLATCISKMDEHDIDASCILAADDIDEAQGCLVKRR